MSGPLCGHLRDSVTCEFCTRKDRRFPEWPDGCPTSDCPGDPRYSAPGRRHLVDCTYPLPAPAALVDEAPEPCRHGCIPDLCALCNWEPPAPAAPVVSSEEEAACAEHGVDCTDGCMSPSLRPEAEEIRRCYTDAEFAAALATARAAVTGEILAAIRSYAEGFTTWERGEIWRQVADYIEARAALSEEPTT